jgi:2-amino-4-hydroxy-6-hydroxymethyldihydropteridine diphosphokinase
MRARSIQAKWYRPCLLLGSNIHPEENLRRAVGLLRQHFVVEKISVIWETPAIGSDGPNFLNAAVVIQTTLDASQLKTHFLRPIEDKLGRRRTADKNAPRTIDIDIVAWEADLVDADVWKYAHAAVPVSELLPCYQSEETGEYLEQAAARLIRTTPITARPELAVSFW